MRGQGDAILLDAQSTRLGELLQEATEDVRVARGEDPRAQLLLRQPLLEWLSLMKGLERRDHAAGEVSVHGAREIPSRRRGKCYHEARLQFPLEQPLRLPGVEAGARAQHCGGQALLAGLVEEDSDARCRRGVRELQETLARLRIRGP